MQFAIEVKACADYYLELTFDTGETRMFDARPYLDRGVFTQLKDQVLFGQDFVAFGTECWPGDLDIAPETLYDRSRVVETLSGRS